MSIHETISAAQKSLIQTTLKALDERATEQHQTWRVFFWISDPKCDGVNEVKEGDASVYYRVRDQEGVVVWNPLSLVVVAHVGVNISAGIAAAF